MKKFFALIAALIGALSLVSCCVTACKTNAPLATEFALHKNFSDHAVLQRRVPIRISGTATAGMAVKVSLGEDCVYAVADEAGNWEAVLPAREATKEGESLTLTVTGADDKCISYNDILVGEVWMCCGQSNMEMPMWTNTPSWRDNNGAQVIAEAEQYANKIRIFNAAANKYMSPKKLQEEPVGKWVVPSSADIARFSAVGYYFGRELNQKLEVPIGLVSTCWSGTRIQPWISADGYHNAVEKAPELQPYATMVDDIRDDSYESKGGISKTKARELEWAKRFMAFNSANDSEAWKSVNFDDSAWQKLPLSNVTMDEPGRGLVRCTIDIPANMAGKELHLKLGAIDDADITYFNGVQVGVTDISMNGYWVAQRDYVIPANLVKAGKAVIAIHFINYYGVGNFKANTDGFVLTDGVNSVSLNDVCRYKLETLVDFKVIGIRPDPADMNSPQTPSTLFNSLIYPWTRYNVAGMIWYQGCSNADCPDEYIALFDAMRADWMTRWNNPKMAFITTQLSGFGPGKVWPRFREAQFEIAQKYANVGLAVSIDKGDEHDIHPHNKQPVGQRLCAEAMRLCYGYKGITSGPVYKSCKTSSDKLVLRFDYAGKGIVTNNGKQPAGFEIAGADGQYYPALAVISDDDEITLSAKQVAKPVSARYAWCAYNGALNVENKDGFPMVPFRTAK
jgi:sialate O-acetylesterase